MVQLYNEDGRKEKQQEMNEEEKDGRYGLINQNKSKHFWLRLHEGVTDTREKIIRFSLQENLKAWTIDVCYIVWILNYD